MKTKGCQIRHLKNSTANQENHSIKQSRFFILEEVSFLQLDDNIEVQIDFDLIIFTCIYSTWVYCILVKSSNRKNFSNQPTNF